jgi:hypothetical protein
VSQHNLAIRSHSYEPAARHRAEDSYAYRGATEIADPPRYSEAAIRLMRLCVIVAVGAVLTGVAVTAAHWMHPTAAGDAVTAAAPQSGDLPWTVPLPTASASSATGEPAPPEPAPPEPAPPEPAPPEPALLGPDTDDAMATALTAYCLYDLGDPAVAKLDADDEWGCRTDRNTVLDVDKACQWFYGDDAWSMTLDDDDPYSWRCFRD